MLHTLDDAEFTREKWSDLPEELCSAIGKRLDTYIDFLRFRSVCESWRSSLPPFHHVSLPFPLKFPSPVFDVAPTAHVFLSRSIVYRLFEPLDQKKNVVTSTCSTSNKNNDSGGWLAKLEESEPGKMRPLHPLSKQRHIRYNMEAFPKVLNLLDFRISELSKSYTLKHSSGTRSSCIPGVSKVVLFPDSAWTQVESCSILAILQEGKLGYAKYGDQKWTLVDDRNFYYDDVIVYKDQFYVVDRWGTVSWVDSSLRLIQFSPPLCGFGSQKHLVESCGDLYVVDRFLDKERRFWNPNFDHHPPGFNPPRRGFDDSRPKAVDFKVYKLDQEWGRWVQVSNLGDRAFVLSNDSCFSVAAQTFTGCIGNCIYYTDRNEDEGMNGCPSRVFDLKETRIGKITFNPGFGFSQIFWPPPTWLTHNPLS